ncbi:hypothetical protein [Paraburkholderia tropica]|uniref:hypothetical protein n=1 Tax=Paraburkholderia tropica TaxID=92647 RepID=UPI002ABE830E|nr:hypothetical protein [Paraburkholderia tropica]
MSRAARHIPALQPGTLEEVVDAWTRIASQERNHRALTVGSRELTYKSAFSFLGRAPEDVYALDFFGQVIFGAATVEEWQHWIVVKTIKPFWAGEKKIPLRVMVKQDEAPGYLTELVGQEATLFCHGVAPQLTASRIAYQLEVDFALKHAGCTVRRGRLTP